MTRRIQPVSADNDSPNWLGMLSSDPKTSRLQRALVMGMSSFAAYRQGRDWVNSHRERSNFIVSITDSDDIYYDVHAWVLRQLPSEKQRSLRAFTRRDRFDELEAVFDPSVRKVRRVRLQYDGSREQVVHLEGHKVSIIVEDPEIIPRQGEDGRRTLGRPGVLTFKSSSAEGRDAVIRLLEQVTCEVESRERTASSILIASKWGDWRSIAGMLPRSLSSVVLRDGLREELESDLDTFMRQENVYRRLGIPWHRGYLLHGPPGVGKTSIAEALAGHFDMDTYYVPLSDLDTDTDLANMMSRIEPRSLLLLEDIDVASASHERSDERRGVSLSGLLNALDGVITPHGLVMIMTTNNLEALDDALIRPGRADRVVELGFIDGDQLVRLLEVLEVSDGVIDWGDLKNVTVDLLISPAEVVEVIKPHLVGEDRTAALAAVVSLVQERRLLQPTGT